MRDQLLFDLTGGGPGGSSMYRLDITMTSSQLQSSVDIQQRPSGIQNYGLDATYVLIETATGKPVVRGTTFARVSYKQFPPAAALRRRPRSARRRKRAESHRRQYPVAASRRISRRDFKR